MGTPGRRVPTALVAFLLIAVCFGLAATYLAAPTIPLAPSTGGGLAPVPFQVVGEIIVGLLVVVAAVLVLNRVTAGRQRWPLRLLMPFLVAFLVAVAFIAVVHFVSAGIAPGAGGSIRHNGTSPAPGSGGGNGTGNGTGYPLPVPIVPGFSWWVGYAILGVVLAFVLVMALVGAILVRVRESEPSGPQPAEEVRLSIAATLRLLESGSLSDARSAIVLLYGRLLERIAPAFEDLSTATAREIEAECVRRLGILPAHARALTRLFEEARYSTHPFTEADVARARVALSAALNDLDRARRPR